MADPISGVHPSVGASGHFFVLPQRFEWNGNPGGAHPYTGPVGGVVEVGAQIVNGKLVINPFAAGRLDVFLPAKTGEENSSQAVLAAGGGVGVSAGGVFKGFLAEGRVAAYLMHYSSQSTDVGGPTTASLNDVGLDIIPGLRLGYQVTPGMALEFGADYAIHALPFRDPSTTQTVSIKSPLPLSVNLGLRVAIK